MPPWIILLASTVRVASGHGLLPAVVRHATLNAPAGSGHSRPALATINPRGGSTMTAQTNITTLRIAERLGDLANEVRLVALAAEGLEDENGELVAKRARDLADEIQSVARDVHQSPPLSDPIRRKLAALR